MTESTKKRGNYSNLAENIEKVRTILKENGPLTFSELLTISGMEKASLYDSLRKMADDTMINDFKKGESIVLYEQAEYYKPLKKADILKWLIIFVLNSYPEGRTVEEITEECLDIAEDGKIQNNIRRYLNALQEEGIIGRIKNPGNAPDYYIVNEKTPILRCASFEQMNQYVTLLSMNGVEAVNEKLKERFEHLLYGAEDSMSTYVRIFGKLNVMNDIELDTLNKLAEMQYKKKHILINDGHELKNISIGVIFYNTETNSFYILGKHGKHDAIIAVSSISEMYELNEDNHYFESSYFLEYFEQLSGPEIASLSNVKIRLKNNAFTRKKIDELTAGRRYATLEFSNDGKEIIYKDKVRGLNQLLHELRYFGADAIVEEPESLKERMEQAAEKMIDIYQGIGEDE